MSKERQIAKDRQIAHLALIDRLRRQAEDHETAAAVLRDQIAKLEGVEHIAKSFAEELNRIAKEEGRKVRRAEIANIPTEMIQADLASEGLQSNEAAVLRVRAAIKKMIDAPAIARRAGARRNPRTSSKGGGVTFMLTKRETKMYDSGDARTWHDFRRNSIMPKVRAELAKGRSVEIQTADGITIDTFNPSDHG